MNHTLQHIRIWCINMSVYVNGEIRETSMVTLTGSFFQKLLPTQSSVSRTMFDVTSQHCETHNTTDRDSDDSSDQGYFCCFTSVAFHMLSHKMCGAGASGIDGLTVSASLPRLLASTDQWREPQTAGCYGIFSRKRGQEKRKQAAGL